MRRIVSVLVVAMVAVGLFAVPAGAAEVRGVVRSRGALTDLQPAATNPTDGATARFVALQGSQAGLHVLRVDGLDPAMAGLTLGTHVHVGPCLAGDGAAAGPHYNTGGAPSPSTEVWLDLTISPTGSALAITRVPFTISSGAAQSVVIHERATQPDGDAGGRVACLPAGF